MPTRKLRARKSRARQDKDDYSIEAFFLPLICEYLR